MGEPLSLHHFGQISHGFHYSCPDLWNTTCSPNRNVFKRSVQTFFATTQKSFSTYLFGLFEEAYKINFSQESADILIQYIRASSKRQYQTSRKSFTSFIRCLNPNCMSEEVVLAFMRPHFGKREFSPTAVATCNSILARPLLWAFDINMFTQLFAGFYWALQNMLYISLLLIFTCMCNSFVLLSGRCLPLWSCAPSIKSLLTSFLFL